MTDDPDAVELPLRSLLDAGAHVCLGSDWRDDNLVPLDPLEEIRAAVERDEEAITVAEGIDCYTARRRLRGRQRDPPGADRARLRRGSRRARGRARTRSSTARCG